MSLLVAAGLTLATSGARPSDVPPPYPFEGTWVRADRVCSATAPRTRTYTAREVTSAGGHCTLRRVSFGGGQWDLTEDCRKPERSGPGTELIRMLGPDAMVMKHQVTRLKIPRGHRWVRCPAAGPPPKTPIPAK